MHWRPVLIVLQLTLLPFGKSEVGEELLRKRNAQDNKCPYNLISITSLGHSEGKQQRSYWDQVKDGISGLIWGRETSSLDQVGIISPDAVARSGACRPVQPPPQCDTSSPYRNHDGSCNNLEHPAWGMAGECQLRLLPASYEGSDGFRKSVGGGRPLPEPRDLSVSILPDADRPTPRLSAMFVYFGQFVAHDTMLTPTPTRNIVPCCPYNEKNRARPECAPIFVRPDDPYYSRFNTTCLTFERTNECAGCEGKIEKANRETAALDLSMVYGPSKNLSNALRLQDGTGRMDFKWSDEHKMLLPRNVNGFSNFCPPSDDSKECFLAGDDRVDQHSTLTSLHTLMLREHNRLVKKLKEINPHWDGYTLYLEARKILGGQWQNMVYGEYLPLALGRRHMSHFGLWVGTGSRYNATARPSVWVEVTTAGFRLHSTVPTKLGLRGLRFYETFLNPSLVREGCAENLLRGACRVPPQEFDRYFVEDVSGQFVRLPGRPYGLDTGAIDIQRGRDNGLPPYVKMVRYLTGGQTKINTFESLATFMPPNNIKLLKKNYASVEDVDLWLGLQLERHAPGSVLGFNTATLTALQFHFLKYGDRFYFEHRRKETSFTDAQLTSLRRSTFSKLLCNNMNLTFIQKKSLLLPSYENPIVNCNEIPEVDLSPWKTDR